MASEKGNALNTVLQSVFCSIAGLLMIACGVLLWRVATVPAYIGSVGAIAAGSALTWFLAVSPLLQLRCNNSDVRDPPGSLRPHFDEDQMMTWMLALFGGLMLLLSAVLVAAWATGRVPSGTLGWKAGALLTPVVVFDALGLWGWCRILRAWRSRRLFGETRLMLQDTSPTIGHPIEFSIGPLHTAVQHLLDRQQLSLTLECWADMVGAATFMRRRDRGRKHPANEQALAIARVAVFDAEWQQRVVHGQCHVFGSATPLPAGEVLRRKGPENGYVRLRNLMKESRDFSERWGWLLRVRSGTRTCFYELPISENVAGAPQAIEADQ